jgi:hypothetical protein
LHNPYVAIKIAMQIVPLLEIYKVADFKIIFIQLQNTSLNPKDLRTFNIKGHS